MRYRINGRFGSGETSTWWAQQIVLDFIKCRLAITIPLNWGILPQELEDRFTNGGQLGNESADVLNVAQKTVHLLFSVWG